MRPHRRCTRMVQSYSPVVPTCTPTSMPKSASIPNRYCLQLSHFEYWYINCWTCPGLASYAVKLTLHMWASGLPSNTWFLRPTQVHIQMAFQSVQPFLQVSRSWLTEREPTDHVTPICSNRPRLASAATWPNNYGTGIGEWCWHWTAGI